MYKICPTYTMGYYSVIRKEGSDKWYNISETEKSIVINERTQIQKAIHHMISFILYVQNCKSRDRKYNGHCWDEEWE
jgi:hypothetical protein